MINAIVTNLAQLFFTIFLILIIATKGRIFMSIFKGLQSLFERCTDYYYCIKSKKINEKRKVIEEKADSELQPLLDQLDRHYNNIVDIMENQQAVMPASERNEYIKFWADKYGELEIYSCSLEYRGIINKKEVSKFRDTYIDLGKNSIGIIAGEEGEATVLSKIKEYGDRYTYIDNLVLNDTTDHKQTSESDLIVITNKAVFLIEVKARGLFHTLHITSDGIWEVSDQNNYKDRWDSPVEQNIRHKIILEKNLNEIFGTRDLDFDIVPIIVIAVTNDCSTIINESTDVVLRPSALVNYIESYIPQKSAISDEDIQKIYDSLRSRDVSAYKTVAELNYEKAYPEWEKICEINKTLSDICTRYDEEWHNVK